MFGALVLGGGLLVNNAKADPDTDSSPKTDNPKTPEKNDTEKQPLPTTEKEDSTTRSPTTEDRPADPRPVVETKPPIENCQLTFTLYKYDRESAEPVHTCLDNKTDEEILKVIGEAKKQTCMSPFCGCWLG